MFPIPLDFMVIDLLNDISMSIDISDINLFQKSSKVQPFVQFVKIFFGNRSIDPDENEIIVLLIRGFTYKGFQCQRCDCVLHRECFDRCIHPCQGRLIQV